MLAVSTPTTITISVVGFFALIAILIFARLALRRTPPPTTRNFRVGVFIERDNVHAEEDVDDSDDG